MEDLELVRAYAAKHWPSGLDPDWEPSLEDYLVLAERAVGDLAVGATRGRRLARIAGVSGSGKSSQLRPAVLAWFERAAAGKPVVVTTGEFVKYHPHYEEILERYGEEDLRRRTDGFASVMLFLVLGALVKMGADIVLEVSFLDPRMEQMLRQMLEDGKYEFWATMVAVVPEVVSGWLQGRGWRHTEQAEAEFQRATEVALKFYAEKCPEMRMVLWSASGEEPVYDGPVKDMLGAWGRALGEKPVVVDLEALREAKIRYFRN